MEALERELARQANRLPETILDPVKISSAADIKQVLSHFDPAREKAAPVVGVSAIVDGTTSDLKKQQFKVETQTQSKSMRQTLIDGFDSIKKRLEVEQAPIEGIEINGIVMKPAPTMPTSGSHWVDKLIKQWLGGQRDGLYVVWKLDDGYTYKYDIYVHKLTRTKDA